MTARAHGWPAGGAARAAAWLALLLALAIPARAAQSPAATPRPAAAAATTPGSATVILTRPALPGAGMGAVRGGAAPAPEPASPEQQQILDAWQAFDQHDYARAIAQYEKLAEESPRDAQVLYNLGTAYAADGKNGLAIWRLLQAKKFAPRDRDIRHNLSVLAPHLEEQLAPTPLPPLNWLFDYLTADEWAFVAGGVSLAALLAGTLLFWLPRRMKLRRALRAVVWVLGLTAAVAYPFALLGYHDGEMVQHGVVVAEDVPARIGPSANQLETFALKAGTVVRVEPSPVAGWVRITVAGGQTGYIARDSIRYI